MEIPNVTSPDENYILNKLVQLCDWMDIHYKKIPSRRNKNPELQELRHIIRFLKRGRKGLSTHSYIFKQAYQDYVEQRGYPDIFLSEDDVNLRKFGLIADWMDEHDRKKPVRTSSDLNEHLYGKLIDVIKSNRFEDRHYEKYRQYMESRGYPLVLI